MGHKYASERKLPRTDEQRHAQPEAMPHRGRKDRKRWCGGHVGREHTPEVVVAAAGWMRATFTRECRWAPWRDPVWICRHQEVCSGCGRIMRQGFGRECPDYPAEVIP